MLRFACLQSCVPRDIYKGFSWINGGRPEGQHSAGAAQGCEGALLSGWLGALRAECSPLCLLQRCQSPAQVGVLFLWANTAPVPLTVEEVGSGNPCLILGQDTTYSVLGFLFLRWGLPFLPQLWSGWIATWDIQLASAALASETTRSLRLNKYELSCGSSSITKFCV